MTEEEYAELMKRRKQAAPTRCQPARASGVSVADMASMDAGAICAAMERKNAPKRQKYGNRRVEIDGMKFDSQHEADVYFGTLLPSFKCGAYIFLARQVPFDLPGGIRYIADFVTVSADGHVSVIDAKSEATRRNRVYINKKKQMKACWGIEIQEV